LLGLSLVRKKKSVLAANPEQLDILALS
jgi:hypothetical protein